MKRIISFTIALLISTSPLFAADNDEGIIIRKARTATANQLPQPEEQEELSEEAPAQLTEEEQIAVVKKLNLPGMEDKPNIEP